MNYRAATLTVFLVFAVCWLASERLSSTAAGQQTGAAAQPGAQTRRRPTASATRQRWRAQYSKFSHRTPEHRQACDACHKFPSQNWKEARQGKEAFPDVTEYPEHSSCLNCHRQQFFARERPAPSICSVCHVQVTPRNTVRHPFPSLGEAFLGSKAGRDFTSDFGVNFAHEMHMDLLGLNAPPPEIEHGPLYLAAVFRRGGEMSRQSTTQSGDNCSICHQTYQPQGKAGEEFMTKRPPALPEDAFWLKKGTFKTTPTTHATCFTCHSQDADIKPAPSDCATCHKLPAAQALVPPRADFDSKLASEMGINERTILQKWRRRDSAGAFRHEIHADVKCNTCHQLSIMNTLDPQTLRVPVRSCGGEEGCHITATADEGGILNFEVDKRSADQKFQCTKCHIVFGTERVPETHLKALTAMKAK